LGLNDSQAADELNCERPYAARREYKGCGKSVNRFRNKGDDELLSAPDSLCLEVDGLRWRAERAILPTLRKK
jgi:hypothetical protein